VATKNGGIKKIFPLCHAVLFLDPGSKILDPGSGMDKNQVLEFGIRINIPVLGHFRVQNLGVPCFIST
jgi:hypothetical protein